MPDASLGPVSGVKDLAVRLKVAAEVQMGGRPLGPVDGGWLPSFADVVASGDSSLLA